MYNPMVNTTETVAQIYASSDDTVPFVDKDGESDEDSVKDFDGARESEHIDSGDDEVGGHDDMQDVHPNIHIPFYHNGNFDNFDNVGSITNRDVVEHWPLWDSETAYLEK